MYAGRLVERATAAALFRAPRHPYSLGLLSSFPSLHGPRQRLTGIPGSPPDLRDLPRGCVFHPRCPYVMDRCRTDSPPLAELGGGGPSRQAACWLHDGQQEPPAPLALPWPATAAAAAAAPMAAAGSAWSAAAQSTGPAAGSAGASPAAGAGPAGAAAAANHTAAASPTEAGRTDETHHTDEHGQANAAASLWSTP
jgi:peptide/nickel transport system ATP-binding protein